MICEEHWMSEALAEAEIALAEGEVPVGAAVVIDGRLVAKAGNRRNKCSDIFGHAEFLA
ncbi:MAG: nucleoside deaminase, partial [bacterium]|nr:nucleoside deaminase [bacterium]